MNRLWMVVFLGLVGCDGTMPAEASPPVRPTNGKILLVGDSLKEGYYPYVHDVMPCVVTTGTPVDGVDKSNDRDTWYILQHMHEWLDGKYFLEIHFNSGMWDFARRDPNSTNIYSLDPTWQSPPNTARGYYRENILEIERFFKKHAAVVIFATTTDVPPDSKGRLPQDVGTYNRIAVKVSENEGVPIDDLNAWMQGQDLLHIDQNGNKVHYDDAGRQLMAEKVIDTLNQYGGCQN